MVNVSIVIPIASYHEAIASEAIAAAEAQTLECKVIAISDPDGAGAGATRNYGLTLVDTPFVVFLDADDLITPDFVEECLKVWQPNRYIYTDWFNDTVPIEAPRCPWTKGDWHPNTTLLPTEWVRQIGGYDTHLPGAEDTLLYYTLTRAGCCGIHLKKPLFTYRAGGQRAESFVYGEHHLKVLTAIRDQFKGVPMGCCGDPNVNIDLPPQGEAQEGFILARPTWVGNRKVIGRATGILYAGNKGKGVSNVDALYVHQEDIASMPGTWQVVTIQQPPPTNGNGAVYPKPGIAELGKRLFAQPMPQQAPQQKPTAETAQQIIDRARKVWNE